MAERKDYVSDQVVRWCPGCGDYAILAAVLKVLPELGIPREKHVFISGIGCSSRFPYYVNTYGFHTIHGRAPAVASGLKCARPDLQVWVVTGDGDGLSIGTNHLIHAMRRNVGIRILLFNNRIYGLTKGQYSPTSEKGKVTKSSPLGSIDRPINPLRIALAAECTFVARAVDTDLAHLGAMLGRAARHKGTSFLEIYQNCLVFNDGAFKALEDRATRENNVLRLENGQPLIYGAKKDRALCWHRGDPKIVAFKPDETPDGLIFHDENAGGAYAEMLARLEPPFPTPVGVLKAVEEPPYEELMEEQVRSAAPQELYDVLAGPDSWEVR
ncbi:MAG: 2-oxoacid:ferredoxin oxidoreductase subunit beta [Elusimicrobiota bacterium]